jgi:hypothetical protein
MTLFVLVILVNGQFSSKRAEMKESFLGSPISKVLRRHEKVMIVFVIEDEQSKSETLDRYLHFLSGLKKWGESPNL